MPLFSSPGPNTSRRRRNQILLWVGSILATITLYTVIGGFALDMGIPAPLQQAAIVMIVIALVALTLIHWRELDEVGRQAHAMAFWWSGMTTWTVLLLIGGLTAAGGDIEGPMFPALGSVFLVIGMHAVLYLAFYAFLWIRNRMP